MSDPCCECMTCTCTSLACCCTFIGSCFPLDACWCCKPQIKGDDELQNEDPLYNAPRASESRFSALKIWKWKTHREDEEFAAQVMREEGNLQRDPRSTDSQRVRKSNESGLQLGQSPSGTVVDTQPLPSKSMEDGRHVRTGSA